MKLMLLRDGLSGTLRKNILSLWSCIDIFKNSLMTFLKYYIHDFSFLSRLLEQLLVNGNKMLNNIKTFCRIIYGSHH